MFTGIVQGVAKVLILERKLNALSFTLEFPAKSLEHIEVGASIAINGTCLTLVSFDGEANTGSFDCISTTLELTNLGLLEVGDQVNFERSFQVGTEVGGHIMSGHIDQRIAIVNKVEQDNIYQLAFSCPASLRKYLVDKGFVGIDGMSLTISGLTNDGFTVNLIPETLARTTIGSKNIGDFVNLEIDNNTKVIVNTLENYLRSGKLTQLSSLLSTQTPL